MVPLGLISNSIPIVDGFSHLKELDLSRTSQVSQALGGTPTDLLQRHAVGWASKTQIRDDSRRVHQVKYRTCDSCHWHSWLCGFLGVNRT